MSTLQNFKRSCTVGATCLFTAHWCLTPTRRTVMKVQTKTLAFSSLRTAGEMSWLTMPKASEIHSSIPGVFVITFDAMPHHPLTYDFRETT